MRVDSAILPVDVEEVLTAFDRNRKVQEINPLSPPPTSIVNLIEGNRKLSKMEEGR